ncbi:MAG: isoprenylcysteine carboxylmethyltransferase family protein, partial [Atopobium sp.]|nr:isoprenylcysteine carboxylmethyltransferase family protein [Atopobium sp.]
MPTQNEKKDHLPVLGVGPAYVIVITVLTVACIALSKLGFLPYLRIRATVGV